MDILFFCNQYVQTHTPLYWSFPKKSSPKETTVFQVVLVNVSQAVHLQLRFDVAESHCGPNLFRRISSPMKHIVGRICNATCRANEGPGSLGCGHMWIRHGFFKVIQIWKASTCINYTTFKRCNIIEYDWKQVYIFLKHVVTMATQLLGLGMQWFLFQYV